MDKTLFADLSTGCFEKRFLAYMNAVGLERLTINYSGGGDSGGMDHMEFHPAIDSKVESGIQSDLEALGPEPSAETPPAGSAMAAPGSAVGPGRAAGVNAPTPAL